MYIIIIQLVRFRGFSHSGYSFHNRLEHIILYDVAINFITIVFLYLQKSEDNSLWSTSLLHLEVTATAECYVLQL